MTTVNNFMSKDPIALYASNSLQEVIETFKSYPYDHIPIVNKERKLLGIISKSDMFNNLKEISSSSSGMTFTQFTLKTTQASEVMTKNPVIIKSGQRIIYAIELLLQGAFHALPVTEEGMLIGIVTAKDILEYLTDKNLIMDE